jgi:hypothetical protein
MFNFGSHVPRCCETDHGFQAVSQGVRYDPCLAEHIKGISRLLRYSELPDPHEVHGRIDGRLASPLQV